MIDPGAGDADGGDDGWGDDAGAEDPVGVARGAVAEEVPRALADERLDRVVSFVTGASRAEAAALIGAGSVAVDGEVTTTKSRRVVAGEVVEVRDLPGAGDTRPEPDPTVEVPVVHADPAVLVIDKPYGLVVHPGAGNQAGTLVNGLLARYPELASVGQPERPGIVHRLDRDTSGLLVVARTPAAHDDLVAQLAARSVHRRYDALVWGVPEAPTGAIDAPIGRSGRDRTRMTVREGGKEALTRYEVVARFHDPVELARLACTLETGRTHQIRVHLTAIGHPVVGDPRYGGERQSFPVPRLFLHAAELAFRHPDTGDELSFSSPLPDDLVGVLARLR